MSWTNPIRFLLIAILAAPAFGTVTVNNPSNGETVGSPANYVASSTTGCSKGVATMGVYVDNNLEYSYPMGDKLDTNPSTSAGSHHTVVEEWDYCGGASYTPIDVTVTAGSGVNVKTPSNGGQSGSPAKMTWHRPRRPVAKAWQVWERPYVNNQLVQVTQGPNMNTNISLSPGTYNSVVEEWDYCGGAAYTPVKSYRVRRWRRWWKNLQQPTGQRWMESLWRISAKL